MPSIFLPCDEVGDLLDERRLVDLVGQLGDDDRHALLARLLEGALRPASRRGRGRAHTSRGSRRSAPTGRSTRLRRRVVAEDRAAGREVRAVDDTRTARRWSGPGSSMSAIVASAISPRWCGGMLVAMPTAMPDEPLTSRLGSFAGSTRRLLARAVVVLDEVDGLLVDVGQQLGGDRRHARLGVAHGRRRVAVDRAEVALAVDQRVAQREVLRQAHQRVVQRDVAVRVVLAHHLADDRRALAVARRSRSGPSRSSCRGSGGGPASGRRARRAARG